MSGHFCLQPHVMFYKSAKFLVIQWKFAEFTKCVTNWGWAGTSLAKLKLGANEGLIGNKTLLKIFQISFVTFVYEKSENQTFLCEISIEIITEISKREDLVLE